MNTKTAGWVVGGLAALGLFVLIFSGDDEDSAEPQVSAEQSAPDRDAPPPASAVRRAPDYGAGPAQRQYQPPEFSYTRPDQPGSWQFPPGNRAGPEPGAVPPGYTQRPGTAAPYPGGYGQAQQPSYPEYGRAPSSTYGYKFRPRDERGSAERYTGDFPEPYYPGAFPPGLPAGPSGPGGYAAPWGNGGFQRMSADSRSWR